MTKKVSKQEVLHVANLAHLYLSPKEIDILSEQLSNIVEYISHLSELNVTHIQPMTHILQTKNVFREDTKEESLSKELALQNAPSSEKGFFTVPRVI